MPDYQIRTENNALFTFLDSDFGRVYDHAKNAAHELDMDVGIYSIPIGGLSDAGFVEELHVFQL